MKSLFLCLALAALSAYGGQPGTTLAPVALYTQFQHTPPHAVLEAMQDEVAAIMASNGLQFEWRSLPASDASGVSVELAVVTFKGRCDVGNLTTHSTSPGPLGWTHVSDGVILPFADVDCDGTRGFVGKQLLSVPPEEREAAYGRALGRILAHELYHIFANTTHHGSEGVGKPSYTVRDLLSNDFRFEERETQALKNGDAHQALEKAGSTYLPE